MKVTAIETFAAAVPDFLIQEHLGAFNPSTGHLSLPETRARAGSGASVLGGKRPGTIRQARLVVAGAGVRNIIL